MIELTCFRGRTKPVVGRKFTVGEVPLKGFENNLDGVVFVESKGPAAVVVVESMANLDNSVRIAVPINTIRHRDEI